MEYKTILLCHFFQYYINNELNPCCSTLPVSHQFSLLYNVLPNNPIVFVHLDHFHVLVIIYIDAATISLTCNLM